MRHAMHQTILVVLGLLPLAGCTNVKALEGPPQDLRALYETSLGAPQPSLTTRPAAVLGPGDDPLPALLQPPKVQKVWVPAQHTPEGDLVAGHWTYLLLETPQWRLDQAPTAGLPLAPLPLPTSMAWPAGPGNGPPAPAPTPTLALPGGTGVSPRASGRLAGGPRGTTLPTRPVAPARPPLQGEVP